MSPVLSESTWPLPLDLNSGCVSNSMLESFFPKHLEDIGSGNSKICICQEEFVIS